MVIEVDPEGALDPALGVAKRIPETGRLAVGVRSVPLFDLTLIPFVWTQTNDRSVVELIEAHRHRSREPRNARRKRVRCCQWAIWTSRPMNP